MLNNVIHIYCRFGNIREVLLFANFVRRTNSRIHEFSENYHHNSTTEDNGKFVNSKIREKSQNQKFAEIKTREN